MFAVQFEFCLRWVSGLTIIPFFKIKLIAAVIVLLRLPFSLSSYPGAFEIVCLSIVAEGLAILIILIKLNRADGRKKIDMKVSDVSSFPARYSSIRLPSFPSALCLLLLLNLNPPLPLLRTNKAHFTDDLDPLAGQ